MKNIIQYILETTDMKQKDIATALHVSTAQITKWKKGEYISYEKQDELEKLAGIIEYDVEWTETVKTKENSDKWVKYLLDISEYSEIVYELDSQMALDILKAVVYSGIVLPKTPPKEDKNSEKFSKYYYLIQDIAENYTRLSYWCGVFIKDYNKSELLEQVSIIDINLISYSFKHIDKSILSKFRYDSKKYENFINESKQEIIKYIDLYCEELIKLNLPIVTDYFDLLKQEPFWLEDEAMLYENSFSADKYIDYGSRKIYDSLYILNENIGVLIEKLNEKS